MGDSKKKSARSDSPRADLEEEEENEAGADAGTRWEQSMVIEEWRQKRFSRGALEGRHAARRTRLKFHRRTVMASSLWNPLPLSAMESQLLRRESLSRIRKRILSRCPHNAEMRIGTRKRKARDLT